MPSPKPSVSAIDIRAALRNKHEPGKHEKPAWVLIDEARSGAGHDGNRGQCDMLAVNLWQSRGMQLVGYEIKVSVRDMRAEIAKPEKAERFARYCRTWWIVCTKEVWDACGHEIPPTWGVMTLAKPGGRLRTVSKPDRRDPEPVPDWWWVGWLGQVYRDAHTQFEREVQTAVASRVTEAVERERAYAKQTMQMRADGDAADLARMREVFDAIGLPRYVSPEEAKRSISLDEAVRRLRHVDLAHLSEVFGDLAEAAK